MLYKYPGSTSSNSCVVSRSFVTLSHSKGTIQRLLVDEKLHAVLWPHWNHLRKEDREDNLTMPEPPHGIRHR